MEQLGSYRLRKRLAVGGMGEVYLGEKIGPEGFVKPVVLKCVLPQLAKDRAFVNLFLDEARLAALLNHPNIAQVYDFGLVDEVYYIAMEYVPGYTVDDLRRKLKSIDQHMPLQHVACIASQVCQGLHYAHTLTDASGDGLGLVHRDVSPHNLIVSVDGSVKIVDFGIAKARAGLTRVQAKGAVGKFGYMSPEQSRGAPVDGRSDVFSLGVCLWELSTNERLHPADLDAPPEYTAARPVRSIESLRAEVPRQMIHILETALAIEAEDRYPTARDMHLALERFQAAMTHYAGQAALAQYIKDLVEGRIEHPHRAGGVVEPATTSAGIGHRSPTESLDGARVYEEVFGVGLESERPRPTHRAVPASWEPRPRTPSVAEIEGQQRLFDLRDDDLLDSGVELMEVSPPRRTPSQSSPIPTPRAVLAPRTGPSPTLIFLGLVVAALLGLGVFVLQNLDAVTTLLPRETPDRPERTSVYRIESDPPGASVFLDGQPVPGVTPVETELLPDSVYVVTVRRPGYATATAEVRAAIGTEIRPLPFRLEPAATLIVQSEPPGASVSVAGRNIPNRVTPLTLDDVPAGRELTVTLRLSGYPTRKRQVRLRAGRSRRINVRFEEG
ncbi:MAG: serine/threonine-protein kinase [Myxococcota bacterium]